ncbi:MAG: DUF2946 family protein [Burkholderiaceae bacterium]
MDDIVKAAMAKWPQVPHCYGWLGLDARGDWYMRDDGCQAAGTFASACAQRDRAAKGSRLQHEKLIEFIGRNYASDPTGQWFFQNGPQRVFVELEDTPVVWRVQDNFAVHDHTGCPAQVQACYADESGRGYLSARRAQTVVMGLVHSQDMLMLANALEQGIWQVQALAGEELPKRFAFIRSPQEQHRKSAAAQR